MSLLQSETTRFILLATLFSLFWTPATAGEPDFSEHIVKPRNIIYGEDARQFVKRFRQIVKNKDLPALKTIIDEKATFSLGGHSGIEGFIELWELTQNPDNSVVWQELQKILDLGGISKSGTSMIFPYLFTDWPDKYDAFEYDAIIGERVNLRAKPSTNSQIIRQMSHEIVLPLRSTDDTQSTDWQKIQTHDQKTGYVSTRYLRSPIDYRAGFDKSSDGWKMTFFVAGD